MISLVVALKIGGGLLTTSAAGYKFATSVSAYNAQKRAAKLEQDIRATKFTSQFARDEIAIAVEGYIQPSCSPTDPSNNDDEAYLSDIREPIFHYMDRAIFSTTQRSYTILLADSGMGKTSFCIAYSAHLLQKHPDQDVAVVSLAQVGCDGYIRNISNKSQCVLILDAFDEDAEAIKDGKKRLDEILQLAADFQSVVITCRSQFFADDHAIPLETPIRMVAPRSLGQNQNAKLKRFYLAPFDERQVTRYINKHFPLWNVMRLRQRFRAFKLVSEIPDLAARPMLLERLPEIARGDENPRELYELYDFMIAGWAERERTWIPPEKLLAVSQEIAVCLFTTKGRRSQRISKPDLQSIANTLVQDDPDWGHLQTRSLLNRDSQGLFKFAHLSILEFFVVKAALEGDQRAISWPWTAFMKQLFISWGYYRHSEADLIQVRRLMTSPTARTAIFPLSDYWATPPRHGMPNFKSSATRRTNEAGSSRLAIPQWRESSISVFDEPGQVTVTDHEFYIEWLSYTRVLDDDTHVPMSITQAQKITQSSPERRFPSYDEFISLVEGLDSVKRNDLLEDQVFVPISDSPGQRRHLLVSLGKVRDAGSLLKVVDRERIVSVTSRSISCYETGQIQNSAFAAKLQVFPWWIIEK